MGFHNAPDYPALTRYTVALHFSDDVDSHKLCVHSRIGDFAETGTETTWESKMPFTNQAINFTGTRMAQQRQGLKQKVSLLLFGDERTFLEIVASRYRTESDNSPIHRVYIPHLTSRGDDLCFAAGHCDSALITAPHSTFAWWMAWLAWMREGERPRGKAVFFDVDMHDPDYHTRDNFLPEWTALRLVLPLKSVVVTPDGAEGEIVIVP